MYWRLKRAEWSRQCGKENKRALQSLVDAGNVPGIIAYTDGKPVGWCSVAPREQFGSLERSRKYKRIDPKPVWSIVCFYVAQSHRRTGVTVALIRAACEFVRSRGGRIVEGYPVHPQGKVRDVSAYMGTKSAFDRAGFIEAARIDNQRAVMRKYLDDEEAMLPKRASQTRLSDDPERQE